ncbi:T9SS type A sorting domain-containing protein [Taibaiella soli]|nr:T9SS type A sorting domain-containing protein [Taibaiella soli]
MTISRSFDGYSETLNCNNDPSVNACAKTFVFNLYEDDTLNIDWDFSGSLNYYVISQREYQMWLVRPGQVDSLVRPDFFLGTPPYYPQIRIPMSSLGTGNFRIRFDYFDVSWVPEIFIDFNVVKHIDKVWVEAPSICLNDFINAHQDYHFNIQTSPNSVNDFMSNLPKANWYVNGQGFCIGREQKEIIMESQTFGPLLHGVTDLIGSTFDPATAANPVDHYITYNDLLPYLNAGNPSLPLNIHYNDGIRDFTFSAPIIFNNNSSGGTVNSPSAAYHYYDYTVQGNETWDPQHNPAYGAGNTLRIEHRLYIPAGATLNIGNMNIEFGPDADVWIDAAGDPTQRGGYLNLEGTTLTAFAPCDAPQSNWKGIVAVGNNNYDQAGNHYPLFSYLQGRVRLYNSTISYATEAFRNGDPADPVHKNGGILYAYNSHFYNNEHSARFMPYLYSPQSGLYDSYAGTFSNCDFTVDQGNFGGFIYGQEVRGLDISGCSFTAPNTSWQLANGIEGVDFGVIVHEYTGVPGAHTPCSFNNLNNAISIGQTNPMYTLMRVTNASFNNNKIGVLAQNITAPMIQYNQFYIPQGSAGPHTNACGVEVFGGSGYHVSENKMQGMGFGNAYNIGALAWATGSGDNVIKRNNYTGLGTASLSNYANTNNNVNNPHGLQFLCNQNSGNTNDIAARGSNTATDGMAPNQGAINFAAGNTFSHTSGGWDIYNPATEVGAIKYYYANGGIPTTYSGGVSRTYVSNNGNTCPEDIIPSGTVSSDNGQFSPLDRTIRNLQFYQFNDKGQLDLTNLRATLAQWSDPHADLTTADLMIETGQWEEANNLYNQIVTKYGLQGQEANEFSTFGRQLLDLRIRQVQNGQSSTQLEKADIDLLQTVAANSAMWPKLRAQSWLQKYDGRVIQNTVLYPDQASNPDLVVTPYRTVEATADVNTVYPNPATDMLMVQYTAVGTDAPVFELMTVDGKTVRSAELIGCNQQVSLQGLAAGLYQYRVLENGKTMMQGKITKQ